MDAIAALRETDKGLRNGAIVYLYHDKGMSCEIIANLCGLAISTVKTYVKKFINLLAWAREQFKETCKKFTARNFYVYIDKVTMPNGETWCKIGQTTQTPNTRAKTFKWHDVRPSKVEVMRVFHCKDMIAMCNLEDLFRIAMTEINPAKFCKNDRLLVWDDSYPDLIVNNDLVQTRINQYVIKEET